jgi:hypothetical protein
MDENNDKTRSTVKFVLAQEENTEKKSQKEGTPLSR